MKTMFSSLFMFFMFSVESSLRTEGEFYPTSDTSTLEGSLPNPLLQDGEVEEVVEFPDVDVRYVRFQVLTFWRLGGGLQYIRPFYRKGD